MATSRSNVVASAAGSGTMRGASTARAHSPGRDYHYESPNEDNQPPFFSMPFQARWLTGIGLFFFMLNLCLFLLNCVMISIRFRLHPGSFTHSFTDQVESLFIPAFFVSIAIIMINICEYGVDSVGVWLLRTMEFMFWFYVALSTVASAGMYLILWSTLSPNFTLSINATAVALCAVTAQGTGCLIAFMISAAFIYRLMTQKLPRDMQRPGVFISIGPFGFTAASIAQLGSQADIIIPPNFLGSPYTVDIVRVVSVLVALWLWGLSMWFFLVSVGSLWKYVRTGSSIPFQMTWWSFVFPNTALVTATEIMSEIFDSRGLQIAGAVMAAALIIVWIIIFITMLRCLKQKKLLWPKDNT
ncbi:hypothetical protein ACO1O0_004340 [Amphichorda felina]